MSSSVTPDMDPRPWWHRDLEDRINKRFDGIERIQRVQTIAFITAAPAIAASAWLAGRVDASGLSVLYGALQALFGWAM